MVFCMNDFLFIAIYFRKHEYVSCVRERSRSLNEMCPVCMWYVHLWKDSGEMGEAKKTDRCLKYSAHFIYEGAHERATLAHLHIRTYTIYGK